MLAEGTWRVQSVEHVTLDLGVVSSSPMLGVEITFKNRLKKWVHEFSANACVVDSRAWGRAHEGQNTS